jgi:hypothetical protein
MFRMSPLEQYEWRIDFAVGFGCGRVPIAFSGNDRARPVARGGDLGRVRGPRLGHARPPRLIAKAATGAYRIDTKPLPKAPTLTYPDLAAALLDSLERPELYRRAAYVAN